MWTLLLIVFVIGPILDYSSKLRNQAIIDEAKKQIKEQK